LRKQTTVHSFDGRVAAITGAGSGIGRSLALQLAGRGAPLALSDIDETGLADTVSLCGGSGVSVTSQRLDVADRHAIYAWADRVVADHGKVNLIFNNAGVGLGATIDAMSYEDFEWLMDINFWGVVYGTKAFLPHLRAAGEGHVVNVSSVFGLISIPTQSAYNASKFAVRGFTDALRMELEMDGCGVSSTTVHPGGIKTNIARNARLDPSIASVAGSTDDARRNFDKMAFTSPDKAARQILAAVGQSLQRQVLGHHLQAGIIERLLNAAGEEPLAEPPGVEIEQVRHPLSEACGIDEEAVQMVEHVLERVVGRVADVRFRIDGQPGLSLGGQHVVRVEVGAE